MEPKFLYYYTQSRQFEDQILPLQKGVNYPAVLDREVKAQPIAYPSRAEQCQVVDILEDHLSRLDAAMSYQATVRRRLSSLRDELIRRAVTGDFLPSRPTPNRLNDCGTQDGELPSLPIGWEWRRLGEVAEVVGGVTKDAKTQSDPALVEVPYLRVANVQRGSLRLDQVSTIRVAPEKAAALRLQRGDVLLNEGGDRDKLARGWVWDGEIDPCIHQNHVFRARIHAGVDPYFLAYVTNSIGGRWAERNAKQSVNLASISLSMIRRMPVVVPPPGVSESIASTLRAQLADTDRLERAIEHSQTRVKVLRRAILAAAFEGKLTGRRTDDEVIEAKAEEIHRVS